ncbi:MAG TPA: Ppx/GppA phosphatase family protein [bacterium]|nr:Ppx/GppA phosphatase family protein [bacterium]
MPTLAAIDVGSNAMRLAIGFMDHSRKLHVVEDLREPVRLGLDVFTKGSISRETTRRSIEAFQRFKEVIEQHQVVKTRAVATSALREALNRDAFIKKIQVTTGLDLKPINAEEEALLVYLAVSKRIPLEGKTAMLIDIGGGSVEITLARNGKILATESFQMGAVRLLQVLEQKKYGEKKFNKMVQEYTEAARKRFNQKLPNEKIDIGIGTGGNLDALADLKGKLLREKEPNFVTLRELDLLISRLQKLTLEDRIVKLGLRPDRADVILPASLVLRKVMETAKVNRVYVPHVGVKEGLLIDMVSELLTGKPPLHRDEVLGSARRTGLKYSYDELHANTVSRLSLELFDKTKKLHRLGDEHKLPLEAAAQLHDIGQFVNYAAHHKHSYYLIKASQLIGLKPDQVELVANISRYHRKAMPKLTHENYRLLPPRDRVVMCKLAAILRVADAMDHDHSSNVQGFRIQYKKPHFSVKLLGQGDMLLEKWSLLKKCDLFEKVFKVKFSVRS